MIENVALKTQLRTYISMLAFAKNADKHLTEIMKELGRSEALVEELDDVKDDIRQENDDLRKLKKVESITKSLSIDQ